MAKSPCVVLYGNSVFLAGIRTDLRDRTQLELVTVEPVGPNAARLISAYHPAAVLFDVCIAEPDFAVALLRAQPELILIGVDPSSDSLLVLSGRHEQPTSAADLVQLLIEGKEEPPRLPGCGLLQE